MVIIGDDFTLGFNPLLFGVARESLARSIRYLPSGWEQFREQLDPPAPPRESLPDGDKTDKSVPESLHCWKHWAEVRLQAVALLHRFLHQAFGVHHFSRVPPELRLVTEHLRVIFVILEDQSVAEFLEHQVYLISPDWLTYLINLWLVGSRILEPDIVRARQQGAVLALDRRRLWAVSDDYEEQPGAREAHRQWRSLGAQFGLLAICIRDYRDQRKRAPYAQIGAAGRVLPPLPPVTTFAWSIVPSFFPESPIGRSERRGFSESLRRQPLFGPLSLVSSYSADLPFPFEIEEPLYPPDLPSPLRVDPQLDPGRSDGLTAKLRRLDSARRSFQWGPVGVRYEVNYGIATGSQLTWVHRFNCALILDAFGDLDTAGEIFGLAAALNDARWHRFQFRQDQAR